jgi:hypothetical protein
VKPTARHDPGALVYFRHRDATREPKQRPGVVDKLRSGNLTLFYGSTFKKTAPPKGSIEAHPHAEPGTPPRVLADYLNGFVDEQTYFHGSLVSETPLLDEHARPFPNGRFPNDYLDELREQAHDRVLAFVAAWDRLGWLLPAMRTRILDALWWHLETDAEIEALMTFLLCDGWSITEIADLAWRDIDPRSRTVRIADDNRHLLPRTSSLLAKLATQADRVFAPYTKEQLLDRARQAWEALTQIARPRGRRSSPFPTWERVRQAVDR